MFEHWFSEYSSCAYCGYGSWVQYSDCKLSGNQPHWVPDNTKHVSIDIENGIVECYDYIGFLTSKRIATVNFFG